MKKKVIFLFSSFLFLLFSSRGFPQYAYLDGKWIEIHAPAPYEVIGIGRDKEACDELIQAVHSQDRETFTRAVHSFEVLGGIPNYSKAIVLEINAFEGKAKILLLSSIYRGFTGWIPLEWLDGNEDRPQLVQASNFYPSD